MTITVPWTDRKLQNADPALPESGVTEARLLGSDMGALAARLDLIASATHTVDIQYYYWANDLSGRFLMAAALSAADKGIKVRILLDDLNAGGLDRHFAALDAHPGISVRLFNPLRFRFNGLARLVALLSTFVTANNRMHNKNLVIDRSHAIVGGRNLGDPYFGLDHGTNFHDIDMHVSGKAAREAAGIFDTYWTATASRRVSRVIGRSPRRLGRLRAHLRQLEQTVEAQDLLQRLAAFRKDGPPVTLQQVEQIAVAADPPSKAVLRERKDWLGPRIEALIESAQREVLLFSPYLVPGKSGCELLKRTAARGVQVKVLTNSLAATDVVIAHSGYARYRRPLLEAGVGIYEQPARLTRERMHVFGSRKASLHTKSVLVDGQKGFVGSFNFDPRSKSINTEMGVFFDDARLGGRLHEELQGNLNQCLRVSLNQGALVWHNATGVVVSRDAEPLASPGQRIVATIAGLLPLESQL
ncbi:MAG: phospholipase D family protein [Rhizobiales bacterium]|nr:phospholipase D family protein [Hyphomicrobiales bacterium]